MSDKKCCVPGCTQKQVLHRFPNPDKDKVQFDLWVSSIGGNILTLQNEFIHKYRRVCSNHFDEKYFCRNNRISKLAIPTLMMPDSLLSGSRPMRQMQNLAEYLASTSQHITDLSLPRQAKKKTFAVTCPEQNLCKKLLSVRSKLYKCRSKMKKQMAALMKAKKMISDPNNHAVLDNMSSASKILTLINVENIKKPKVCLLYNTNNMSSVFCENLYTLIVTDESKATTTWNINNISDINILSLEE